jgi:glyoxylase-like metal-dependent hydrolase (beta-lactamase superfamily II)
MKLYPAFTPLALACALVIVAPVTSAAEAAGPTPQLTQSQAGYYRFMVGRVEITALSDGTIGLDTQLLQAPDRHAIDGALKLAHVRSPLDTSVNAYLVKLAGRLILVDAGTGTLFGPSLNKLPASLRAAGVEPEQITDVLITHVHTDHTGGLMSGERRVYPNATLHVDQREIDYWLDATNEQSAPAAKQGFFRQARASLAPYVASGQVRSFDGAQQLFPGLRSMPAPGHTPGHTFYALEDQGIKLVFWGDVMHVAEVQLADPSVTIAYDVDPAAARAQRLRAFADAAQAGYLVAPAHMAFPGVGRLRLDGKSYRWQPLPYVNDASAVH